MPIQDLVGSPPEVGSVNIHLVHLVCQDGAVAPLAAFLSFRLGFTDGVSVVAEQWQRAFEELGWRTTTVGGGGIVNHLVPGLAIGATTSATRTELDEALEGADLVIVENLLTIPMNLDASAAVADALRGRPALLHHHDPPWQRER